MHEPAMRYDVLPQEPRMKRDQRIAKQIRQKRNYTDLIIGVAMVVAIGLIIALTDLLGLVNSVCLTILVLGVGYLLIRGGSDD